MTNLDSATARIFIGMERGVIRAVKELERDTERDIPRGDPAEDPDAHVKLAASARIGAERGPRTRTARLSYDAPYAKKQHEAQSYRHLRGGKAKFLEGNLAALEPRLAAIIAEEIRRVL